MINSHRSTCPVALNTLLNTSPAPHRATKSPSRDLIHVTLRGLHPQPGTGTLHQLPPIKHPPHSHLLHNEKTEIERNEFAW
jgi:hypothetical protein